jgi:chemotaxis protein methyltransferase CheR
MLTEQQFLSLSNLLKDETAVVLGNGKEYLVESRLTTLAREEGFASLTDLIDAVLSRANPALNKKALLALTTNETSFFRDLGPFELLKRGVLPELIEKRASRKALSFWCAACSSGQEPYSIGMLIRDTFPDLKQWQVKILASDVHSGVIEKAKAGIYSSLEVNRGLPAQYLIKFFLQNGDKFEACPELKSMVNFFEHNLVGAWNIPQVDVIFMRNVLIYFDTQTKKEILERVKSVLAPDGYLFLGTAESPFRIVEGFEKVDGAPNVYRMECTKSADSVGQRR